MSNDIVTRLRERADERMEAREDYWQGHKFEYDIPYIENQAADEIERLRGLLMIFDIHFVCDECDKACATYLQGCENPLHALHTAAWELF